MKILIHPGAIIWKMNHGNWEIEVESWQLAQECQFSTEHPYFHTVLEKALEYTSARALRRTKYTKRERW